MVGSSAKYIVTATLLCGNESSWDNKINRFVCGKCNQVWMSEDTPEDCKTIAKVHRAMEDLKLTPEQIADRDY